LERKVVSGIMLTLLISMLTLAFNIQLAKSEPAAWTVDDDGPADFHTIQEAINVASPGDTIYVSSGTYYEHVVVNKTLSLIGVGGPIIDASLPATVDPSAAQWNGMTILEDHCTIEGFEIRNADNFGIEIQADYGLFKENLVEGCNFAGISCYAWAHDGVSYHSSHDNSICNNTVIRNNMGALLGDAYNNLVSLNIIERSEWGIYLCEYARNNLVTKNSVSNITGTPGIAGGYGIAVGTGSHNNLIVGNNISNNVVYGISIELLGGGFPLPHDNSIHHNNFVDNTVQAYDDGINNFWDDGYSSGGNYWSDYSGVDLYSGPYQNELGSDGIGDTPYVIDENNRDNYPLMKPYPWATHDIGITSVTTSKTIIGQGYNVSISIMTFNYGNYTENINLTIYANTTIIGKINNIDIASRNFTTLTLTWNTTGVAKGNYTITAEATQLPHETDTADNTVIDGWVFVTIPGDVNGDKTVNILDCILLANHFGHTNGNGHTPNTEEWRKCMNCNINCDGNVNILDCIILAGHFGQRWP